MNSPANLNIQTPPDALLPEPVREAAATYHRLLGQRAATRQTQIKLQRRVTTAEQQAQQAAAQALLSGKDPGDDTTPVDVADELARANARLIALDRAVGMARDQLGDAILDVRPEWTADLQDRIATARDDYRDTAGHLLDVYDDYRGLAFAAAWLDRWPHKPVLSVPPPGWNRTVSVPAMMSEILAATEPPADGFTDTADDTDTDDAAAA